MSVFSILVFGLMSSGCGSGGEESSSLKSLNLSTSFSAPKLEAMSTSDLVLSVDIASTVAIPKPEGDVGGLEVEDHCKDDNLSVLISIADSESSSYTPVQNYKKTCNNKVNQEVAMVLDNSGSSGEYLDFLKQASKKLLGYISSSDGQASITRISTNSSVRHNMSSDYDSLDNAVDELWSSNGYTAMYDAMRMGFGTMNMLPSTYNDNGKLDQFCDNRERKAMVLFSDGEENNSLDDFKDSYDFIKYPGDGIDTKIDDLIELSKKTQAPIFTIGLGEDHDVEAMKKIAAETGGLYVSGNNKEDIPDLFEKVSEHLKGSTSLCFDVSKISCGKKKLKIQYTWHEETDGDVFDSNLAYEAKIFEVEIPCDPKTPITTPPPVVDNKCKSTGNIIVNPSFEFTGVRSSRLKHYQGLSGGQYINTIDSAGEWDVYQYLPADDKGTAAWYTSGGFGIELQNSGTVTSSYHGNKHVELDSASSQSNSSMTQNVYMCPGEYELSVRYYARTSDVTDNNIEVHLDDVHVGTLQHTHDGIWHSMSQPIIVDQNSYYRLTFKGGGMQNSLGGLLDDVSLVRK